MITKIWRIAALALLAVCVCLAVALTLQGRILQATTSAKEIHYIRVKAQVKKDVVTDRTERYTDGQLTEVKIITIDRTVENIDTTNKTTTETTAKEIILTAGYSLTAGTFDLAAGGVIWNTVAVQVSNPIALRFDPQIRLSLIF